MLGINNNNNNNNNNNTSTLCVEMLHSRDLSSSMESLAYDSSSTTSPTSIHPNAQVGGPPQRTKRMRTSFKHHQLRTMKSYFKVNQNPDAKDLKQLAQKTGLSKRVLQVSLLYLYLAFAAWCRLNYQTSTRERFAIRNK